MIFARYIVKILYSSNDNVLSVNILKHHNVNDNELIMLLMKIVKLSKKKHSVINNILAGVVLDGILHYPSIIMIIDNSYVKIYMIIATYSITDEYNV